MKTLSVIQHTQSEWLGHIEDHLEGRGVRFNYVRPFAGGHLPKPTVVGEGLVLIGGGPWGTAGASHLLPTLDEEIRLTRACLMLGKPILAIGLGAQILSLAADGSVSPAPFAFSVTEAKRVVDNALDGFLPASFPSVTYMRDWPEPPPYAQTLAIDAHGRTAVFQIGSNVFGFVGHPGLRTAMIEDLIMEFEESPANSELSLRDLRQVGAGIEEALIPIMTGIVRCTGWMV